jgi:transcriptional regulator CtsR
MKKSLADRIEQYIKVLIARSEEKQIEIQRAELAETFCCVPSQVTYVLTTRFTEKSGYLTESRRGGGGFVRITEFGEEYLDLLLVNNQLMQYIDQALRQGLLSKREAEIIKYVVTGAGRNMPAEFKVQLNEGVLTALRELLEP